MEMSFSVDEFCTLLAALRSHFREACKYEGVELCRMENMEDFSEPWKMASDRAERWHREQSDCADLYYKILGKSILEDV